MKRPLLEKLLKTPSPSGFELEIQKKIIEEMKDYDDDVIKSQDYNVIHIQNPKAKTKLLFLTHIDEIGLIINDIKDNGICEVENIGAIRPYMYAGQHVVVLTKKGQVPGIIGYLPNMDKGIKTDQLMLDLGCSTKEQAKKLVEVGNPVIVNRDYEYLANNRLAAKALDDKLAAYIILEAYKRVKGKTKLGIYVSTTVGEETTARGAQTAVQMVKPTASIACDVCYANDLPYYEGHGEVKLGNGPVLTEGSFLNKILDQMFIESTKRLGYNYQREVATGNSWTDADLSYYQNMGTPTYLVSIPLRYMHSSVELCDLKDVDQLIDLFTDFILNFDENKSLNPFDY